ncbi:MAG: hypothetical protein JNL74_21390, partial [Fibrobacteres bacterium]|nr:hypothetical protein [Fibrobacterota bacterium]
ENKIQWTVDIGTVTVDGKQWNRLSIRPDIPIGKLGICLDIELFVDDSGQFSDKGWRFSNGKEAFESISRKIYYLRWGRPGHKIYGKVGSLDEVSLGYGLIMQGYSNALQYPDIRKTGIHFELNDMSPIRVGIQGMINNFLDFQNGGALIGTRLYVKPLSTFKIPVLSNLTFAGTYVSDFNQRAVLSDMDGDKVADWLDKAPNDKNWSIEQTKIDVNWKDSTKADVRYTDSMNNVSQINKYSGYIDQKDPFAIAGADIGLPIINGNFFKFDVYAQYAKTIDTKDIADSMETSGWGITAPGFLFKVGKFFSAKLEYRYFKDQFEAEYFDRSYELNRMMRVRIDSLTEMLYGRDHFLARKDSSTLNGIFGRANFNIVNIVDVGASYQWMKFSSDLSGADTLGLPEQDQSFTAEAKIGKIIRDILNKVKIDDISAYYTKKNIGTWIVGESVSGKPVYDKFLEPTPYVLTGYKVGFKLSESMIFYYDQQYTYEPDPTTDDPYKLKVVPNMKIGTQVRF